MEKKVFIEGMKCGNCVSHVVEALRAVCGVDKVVVDLKGNFATLELQHPVDDEKINAAVKDAGYTVTSIH